ncbi:UNVERIFIED_CONTAM: hypothetical protein Slati_1053600 [Sesamum latifolium]|uniref:Reverse transcriptase zinc-binding domain-containing protein n=1 Tax=Sesamum latifolium TaxID=2727402 RepID=A0AAW2XSK3_9LAMI
MSAQALLRAGCRWRVGSGSHIRIWQDPWLPRPLTFRPVIYPPPDSANMRVADLIDPSTGDWNIRLVRELFWPVDSDLILNIPLSRAGSDDILVWHFSGTGMFTVRSAYHLACELSNRPCSSDLFEAEHGWWRKLWQAKIPNKIKVFTWKACLNALPTSVNLARRIQGFLAVCPLCQTDGEDVVHPLILCPFARQIWGLATFPSASIPQDPSDCFQWIRLVADTLSTADFVYQELPPPEFGCPELLALWCSEPVADPSSSSPAELAEALAAREAILLAHRQGWSSVVLEGDCASLIHKLASKSHDLSAVGLIIFDILAFARSFICCNFIFVRRECNSVAHLLAKSGFGSSEVGTVLPAVVASLISVDSGF